MARNIVQIENEDVVGDETRQTTIGLTSLRTARKIKRLKKTGSAFLQATSGAPGPDLLTTLDDKRSEFASPHRSTRLCSSCRSPVLSGSRRNQSDIQVVLHAGLFQKLVFNRAPHNQYF